MCFGAKASISAGTFLVVVGAATLSKVQNKNEVLFAASQLIFGIQQFIEGALWLILKRPTFDYENVLTTCYLIIAFFIWPTYAPLSIYFLEDNLSRRRRMFPFVLLGIGMSCYLVYY